MTNSERLALKKDRLAKLEGSPKNKGFGLINKLKREIRKYEQAK